MRGQLHQFAFSLLLEEASLLVLGGLELVVGCVVVGSGSLVDGGGCDGVLDVVLGSEVGLGSGGGAGASLRVVVSEDSVLLVVVSTSEVVTALLVGGGGGGSIDGVVE